MHHTLTYTTDIKYANMIGQFTTIKSNDRHFTNIGTSEYNNLIST